MPDLQCHDEVFPTVRHDVTARPFPPPKLAQYLQYPDSFLPTTLGGRGGVVVRPLASQLCEPGLNPGFFARGNRAGRCCSPADFLGDLSFSSSLHSDAAPCLLYFTPIDVKSRPNVSTPWSNGLAHEPEGPQPPPYLYYSILLACSPPTKPNRIQSPTESLPDFRMWEPCRTTPLVGGFSHGSPVSPALAFQRCSIQDFVVKSRPSHSTQLVWNYFPSIVANFTEWMTLSAPVKIYASGEVSMEQRQNEGEVETGDLRENPSTSGIVRHDSHMPKPGNRARFAQVESEDRNQLFLNEYRCITSETNLGRRGAMVAGRLACSPPTKANRVQSSAGSPRIFSSGNRSGRCRWSADSLGDIPFPAPFHSGAAPFSSHSSGNGSQDFVVKSRPNLSTQLLLLGNSAGMKGPGKREILKKTHRPTASSSTIPTCENPVVTRSGIEPGSPWWEASRLTAQPPRPLVRNFAQLRKMLSTESITMDYKACYIRKNIPLDYGQPGRLARSPPIKANRVQSPVGSPDFRKWKSCRTMPLVGGFPRGSPVSPAPSFRRRSIFTSITLIGSEDLAVKSRPNLFPRKHACVAGKTGDLREKPADQRNCPARFPLTENPGATPSGIEPGSPRREASNLTSAASVFPVSMIEDMLHIKGIYGRNCTQQGTTGRFLKRLASE
ncbi:hypothetical protein PR048_017971 [Dryococelus australis]|uniref:Uncharacterized protein n=1 Tax=Dryococelus australis TaxID=614101 RepID=A0ABQ9HB10_9NEOP|nr:hypothetical protein PR048_017971 [Dryococelus australis]